MITLTVEQAKKSWDCYNVERGTAHIIESVISRAGVIGTCYGYTLYERREKQDFLKARGTKHSLNRPMVRNHKI